MPKQYSPELRERAVRLVAEHRDEYATEHAAIRSIAAELGIAAPETLRRWVRQARMDSGQQSGISKILAKARVLLPWSPIILAVVYVFEYTYVYQFLGQFGVTPEQVGISEVKLLTRAALFTVVILAVLGILPLVTGVIVTGITWIQAAEPIRPILRRPNSTEQPGEAQNSDLAEGNRRISNRALAVRLGATLAFALAATVMILLMKPLGYAATFSQIIVFAGIGIAITALLFVGWRKRSTRYFAWTCGVLFGVVLLSLTAFYGGTHKGTYTAGYGRVPDFAGALGIDIFQVHPMWIEKRVIPPHYRGQDLLEVGSDDETVFLYDCWTQITYRIPLADLILNYPLTYNNATSTDLSHLDCRP